MSQACLRRDEMLAALENSKIVTVTSKDELRKFAALPLKEKGKIFEQYCLEQFYDSEYACYDVASSFRYNTSNFRDIIEVPFENTYVPCPIGYDDILTGLYGDWHKFVMGKPTQSFFSVDISYKDILKKCEFIMRI